MNLDDLNSLKSNKNNETSNNSLTNIINDLQNIVGNFIKNSLTTKSNSILDDYIYVVRDINNQKLSLVNIENGSDVNIYVADSKDKIEELHSNGIYDNIYEISEEELYNLNLGSNVIIRDNKCIPYYGEIEIKNHEAAAKLEDMYFCLEQEKEAIYSVSSLSDEKIYLTNIEEGGYFSIPQKTYPNFKVGDLVKNIDGKYTLI